MAERIGEFHNRYSELLQDGMLLAEAGKSLAVRIEVSPVRAEIPIGEAEEEVAAALHAAERLLDWCVRHRFNLEQGAPEVS